MDTNNIPFSIPFPGTENRNNSMEWMNNPFFYLIFLWIFGSGGFGGFGNRNGAVAGATAAETNMTAFQVDDIRSKLSEVAGEVACGTRSLSSLQTACDALGLQVGNLKDAVLQSLCQVGHQIDVGNLNVISAIKDCCCNTGERICGVEKSILAQSNMITQGFANLGFQNERSANAIQQTIATEACNTRQLMQSLHNQTALDTKNAQINALEGRILELSQASQTATLLAAINSKTTTTTTTA